jgi:enediyne biosynthesis thioesterase
MQFGGAVQNRLTMRFDYRRGVGHEEHSVARGEQEVAFLRRDGERTVPAPIPDDLLRAARAYVEASS